MTRDEAREAGRLAKAAADLEAAIDDLRDHMRGDNTRVGLNFLKNMSDAGADILTSHVVISPMMAMEVLAHLQGSIEKRLGELGVTP